jgi:hypothetical protein
MTKKQEQVYVQLESLAHRSWQAEDKVKKLAKKLHQIGWDFAHAANEIDEDMDRQYGRKDASEVERLIKQLLTAVDRLEVTSQGY